jgi:hypothetical protein
MRQRKSGKRSRMLTILPSKTVKRRAKIYRKMQSAIIKQSL